MREISCSCVAGTEFITENCSFCAEHLAFFKQISTYIGVLFPTLRNKHNLILKTMNLFPHKSKCALFFDTFEGLPEPNKFKDFHVKGEFTADYDSVNAHLSTCGDTEYHLIKGYFPDSFPKNLSDLKYNFVHLDVDL